MCVIAHYRYRIGRCMFSLLTQLGYVFVCCASALPTHCMHVLQFFDNPHQGAGPTDWRRANTLWPMNDYNWKSIINLHTISKKPPTKKSKRITKEIYVLLLLLHTAMSLSQVGLTQIDEPPENDTRNQFILPFHNIFVLWDFSTESMEDDGEDDPGVQLQEAYCGFDCDVQPKLNLILEEVKKMNRNELWNGL